MRIHIKYPIVLIILFLVSVAEGQTNRYGSFIASGIPWYDSENRVVSAHGANIIREGGSYYLFGEIHSDTSNAFAGFNCYSSSDLSNWKFEKTALPVQMKGKLGPNRVGERPKVLKNPKTGQYVMLMHTDTLGYKDPCVGYAISGTPAGPYEFKGALLFNGKPIHKWDIGSFQDADGSGYLLVHGGVLYRLSDDYQSIKELVIDNKWSGCESPAMFKKNGVYFWLASDLTSWERNDNFYYTATNLKGPWTARGNFAPAGTLTWNSQTSFVLPIHGTVDTSLIYMGDRWSFPRQASAATYVWQPLSVSGTKLTIPVFYQYWQLNQSQGTVSVKALSGKTIPWKSKAIAYDSSWTEIRETGLSGLSSSKGGAKLRCNFKGGRIALYGIAGPSSGYASVQIKDVKDNLLLSTTIDLYCKYSETSLKFLSPVLKEGKYFLEITTLGDHSKWADKRRSDYGSTGNQTAFHKIVLHP